MRKKKKQFEIGKVYWLPYRGPMKVAKVTEDTYGVVYLEGIMMKTSPDNGHSSLVKTRENTSICIEVDPRALLQHYNKVFSKVYFSQPKKKKRIKPKPRKNAKRKPKARKRR